MYHPPDGLSQADRSAVYNRENTRGRLVDSASSSVRQLHHLRRAQSQSHSPRRQFHDPDLQRRPSYGHHRQVSIVHGVQHSRNPSFAALSANSTPVSPELIASVGRVDGLEPDSGAGVNTVATLREVDVQALDAPLMNNPPKGMNSSAGRPLRERSRSRSHSVRQTPDTKSVGEYALHHLFNSVCLLSYAL